MKKKAAKKVVKKANAKNAKGTKKTVAAKKKQGAERTSKLSRTSTYPLIRDTPEVTAPELNAITDISPVKFKPITSDNDRELKCEVSLARGFGGLGTLDYFSYAVFYKTQLVESNFKGDVDNDARGILTITIPSPTNKDDGEIVITVITKKTVKP